MQLNPDFPLAWNYLRETLLLGSKCDLREPVQYQIRAILTCSMSTFVSYNQWIGFQFNFNLRSIAKAGNKYFSKSPPTKSNAVRKQETKQEVDKIIQLANSIQITPTCWSYVLLTRWTISNLPLSHFVLKYFEKRHIFGK